MGQACVRSDLILFRKRDGPASGMGRDPPQSHSAEKCPDGIKESEQDRAAIKERCAEDPRRSHLLPSTYGIPIWFQASRRVIPLGRPFPELFAGTSAYSVPAR